MPELFVHAWAADRATFMLLLAVELPSVTAPSPAMILMPYWPIVRVGLPETLESIVVVEVLFEKMRPAVVVAPLMVTVVAVLATPLFSELKTATSPPTGPLEPEEPFNDVLQAVPFHDPPPPLFQ